MRSRTTATGQGNRKVTPSYSTPLDDELSHRRATGVPEFTLESLKEELGRIGYRLDRVLDCRSTARWMTGPRAGASYPCMTTGITHIKTGLGFAHVDAPEDENLRKLQELRFAGAYVPMRDYLLEI